MERQSRRASHFSAQDKETRYWPMQDQSGGFDAPTLADPDKVALFLDLDGTVLDIAQVPEEVTTPPDLTAVLGRLQARLGGALAVLTGRKIEDVDRLLSPLRLPAAGVHGSELRFEPEGGIETGSREVPARLVEAVRDFVAATPGLLLEHKGISIAVHYRAVPTMQPVLETELRRLLDHHGSRLALSHGRRVFELVPEGATKGTALARLMRSARFSQRVPVVIGDDQPDEAALATATELGGLGLKVEGEHFRAGGTHFKGPAEVRKWLADLAERLEA
jgi:trehalose 6-phosphate phosphatase